MGNLCKRQRPVVTLVGNLSDRYNGRLSLRVFERFKQTSERLQAALPRTGDNLHALAMNSINIYKKIGCGSVTILLLKI